MRNAHIFFYLNHLTRRSLFTEKTRTTRLALGVRGVGARFYCPFTRRARGVCNTFIRDEQLSRKAHYGRDMGVISVGMVWMKEGEKDEGLAPAGDIVSEVNKSGNICGSCRKTYGGR